MRRCVVRRVAGLAALFARLQRARLRIERRCVFGHHWLLADLLRLFGQRGGHGLLFEHLDRRLVGLERLRVRARLSQPAGEPGRALVAGLLEPRLELRVHLRGHDVRHPLELEPGQVDARVALLLDPLARGIDPDDGVRRPVHRTHGGLRGERARARGGRHPAGHRDHQARHVGVSDGERPADHRALREAGHERGARGGPRALHVANEAGHSARDGDEVRRQLVVSVLGHAEAGPRVAAAQGERSARDQHTDGGGHAAEGAARDARAVAAAVEHHDQRQLRVGRRVAQHHLRHPHPVEHERARVDAGRVRREVFPVEGQAGRGERRRAALGARGRAQLTGHAHALGRGGPAHLGRGRAAAGGEEERRGDRRAGNEGRPHGARVDAREPRVLAGEASTRGG